MREVLPSPALTPSALKAASIAVLPEEVAVQCFKPYCLENDFFSSFTEGLVPLMKVDSME